uniref:hypothetical protein n=1 Tax=Asanoa ferruginea TaxID=53367 RepID=UPI003908954A
MTACGQTGPWLSRSCAIWRKRFARQTSAGCSSAPATETAGSSCSSTSSPESMAG